MPRRRAQGAGGARGRSRPGERRRGGAGARRRTRSTASTPSSARRAAPRPSRLPRRSPASCRASGSATASSGSSCAEREPGRDGRRRRRFLIRPNAGLPLGPVAETASGGELSRVALAIAAVAGGETMVFDEIDAGIGGSDGPCRRRHARRLAERAQVVTITHLPQIASAADRHFRVEKIAGDPTHTADRAARRRAAPRRARADARRRRVSRVARAVAARGRLADPVRSMASVRGHDALVRSKPVSFGTGNERALGDQVRLRHRRRRLVTREGHHRRLTRAPPQGARAEGAGAEVRPVPERRPRAR